MYASLITAGASALYDLYKSATSKTGSTDAASASTQSSASTDASTIGATASTSTSTAGSKFSDALNKLFTDLQASTAGTADSTGTVANDLQSLSKGLAAGAHGHHHGPKPGGDNQSASTADPSSPFQGLASSLVAYAKTQSLGASTSTSLTA